MTDAPARDYHLARELARLHRERVPERVVHAKGGGAHGFFLATENVTDWTRAAFLAAPGRRTDVFVRFSAATGEHGAPDTVREARGFAVRFYTEEGNYDLVGASLPVFALRDPRKFPELVRSQQRRADSNTRDDNLRWDFWTRSPESAHQVGLLMTDRGTPRSWRTMNGYGGHTFLWHNAAGDRVWVRYQLRSDQGVASFSDAEARAMAAEDPDFHLRDLRSAVARGEHPSWTVRIQVMPYDAAADYRFNPFDATKVWPHADFPPIDIGRIVLRRNPENHLAEVERAAFDPANLVPGIGAGPDPLLQARLHAYPDAHRHRLGAEDRWLPVNEPRGAAGPETPVGWSDEIARAAARRHAADDDVGQPRALWESVLTDTDREHMVHNIVTHASAPEVTTDTRRRVVGYWRHVAKDLGDRVAAGLRVDT